MELYADIYVINEEKMIYKVASCREMSSSNEYGMLYNLELVAGYDYINPDENDIQAFVEAENFVEDVQLEQLTVYPMVESLGERLEEEGYTKIDISKYTIYPAPIEK